MEEAIATRQLFGGAVAVALPDRLIDVSDFRPVPDNQEVYTDANEDQSLIVEFVEHHEVPDEESGDFFFDDLATAMDAVQRHITATAVLRSDSVPLLPPGTFCTLISGEVAVSKGRQGAEALNKVQINLLVVRLPNFGTDVLVTLNTPIFISEQSAAAQQAGSGYKNAYSSAPDLFRRIIATLEIRDFGIFGSDATEQ